MPSPIPDPIMIISQVEHDKYTVPVHLWGVPSLQWKLDICQQEDTWAPVAFSDEGTTSVDKGRAIWTFVRPLTQSLTTPFSLNWRYMDLMDCLADEKLAEVDNGSMSRQRSVTSGVQMTGMSTVFYLHQWHRQWHWVHLQQAGVQEPHWMVQVTCQGDRLPSRGTWTNSRSRSMGTSWNQVQGAPPELRQPPILTQTGGWRNWEWLRKKRNWGCWWLRGCTWTDNTHLQSREPNISQAAWKAVWPAGWRRFYYAQGTSTQQHNCVTGKAKLNDYCKCRASGRRIAQQREQLPFITEATESLLFLTALALLSCKLF